MASFPESVCMRCGSASQFQTRISLPPQAIYRCKSCGYNTWVPLSGSDLDVPPSVPPTGAGMQLQQQSPTNEDGQASPEAAPKPTDKA